MAIKVKKITKYSRYFLLIAVASIVSLVVADRSSGNLSNIPQGGVVPTAHADVPGGGDTSGDDAGDDAGDAGADSGADSGADCDGAGADCDAY